MDNENKQGGAESSPASDGSVKPVAWVAFASDASESRAVCLTRQEAENVCRTYGWELAPLYAVRLTDAEREAVEYALNQLFWPDDGVQFVPGQPVRKTILALLERLK